MKDNPFLFLAFMAALLIAGVAFGIWVEQTGSRGESGFGSTGR